MSRQKLKVWSINTWNVCDVLMGAMFLMGFVLRLESDDDIRSAGRVIYCTNIMYW